MSPDAIEPIPDARSEIETDLAAQLTSAARALTLGAALSGSSALRGLDEDLVKVGVFRRVHYAGNPDARLEAWDRSTELLRELEVAAPILESEETASFVWVSDEHQPSFGEQRLQLWQGAQNAGFAAPESFAYMRLMLADGSPVTRVAAATALYNMPSARGTEKRLPAYGLAASTLGAMRSHTNRVAADHVHHMSSAGA